MAAGRTVAGLYGVMSDDCVSWYGSDSALLPFGAVESVDSEIRRARRDEDDGVRVCVGRDEEGASFGKAEVAD